MALQIWFPFNKDTKNHGLCGNITETVTPVLIDSGKMGKALSTGQYTLTAEQTNKILNNDYFSICFWIYINQDSGTSKINTLFGNSGMTPPNNRRFTIYHYNTVNKLHLSWQNYDSSSDLVGYVSGADLMPSYTWTHIAVTYSSKTRQIIIYKNGEMYYTKNNAPLFTNPDYNYATTVISSDSGRYLNDYRVYDHCLSTKEVKEIYKSLVVHYPFCNGFLENTTNLVGSAKYWATGTNTWGGHTYTGTNVTFSNNDPVPVKLGTRIDCTYDSSVGGGGISRYCTTASVSPNTTYTYSIYIKPSDNFAYVHPNFLYRYEYKQDGSYVTESGIFNTSRKQALSNGWYRVWGTFTTNENTNTISLYFYSYPGKNITYWLSCIQLEQKDHMTEYTESSRDNNIISDASGFDNHGTVYGNPVINTGSARNDKSLVFDGGETSVLMGNLANIIHDGIFSMNVWINVSSFGSKGWGTIFGGPSGFEYQSKRGSTNSPVLVAYSWGQSSEGGQSYELNKWNMVTMVRTTSNCKFYLNGTLYYTGSAGYIPSGNYFFGSWSVYNSQNYKGSMSDARIYCTALSDSDILELYNTGAIIDNLNTTSGYQMNEQYNNICVEASYGIVSKQWIGGLSSYTQAHCQCTLTDDGYRIYRTPNKTYPGDSTVMWGGFVLNNGENNRFNLQQGHRYMIQFEVKGQTSNVVTSIYWSNLVGWGGGGLSPNPSNVETDNPITSNYQSDEWKTFTYKFTINDTVYKTCTSAYYNYVQGETYMSYTGFKYGFDYMDTGALGTDLYIRNLRMYDITNGENACIYQSGIVGMSGFVEEDMNAQVITGGSMVSKQFIEY